MISVHWYNLIKDGEFNLGISGSTMSILNVTDNFDPKKDELLVLGETFGLSIGLFFCTINLMLHKKFYDVPEKLE